MGIMPSRHVRSLLKIDNALFKKIGPKKSDQEFVFEAPVKSFLLGANDEKPDSWGIYGPRKSDFLKIVASKFVSIPPLSLTHPYFAEIGRPPKIQFIDFRDSSGLEKNHLSARYESFSHRSTLEVIDDIDSVQNYVSGKNNFNQSKGSNIDEELIQMLLNSFNLIQLRNNWVNSLSNGQMRRARLAKAIYARPDILVIDDPFLGLDSRAVCLVSEVLEGVARNMKICIVAGFGSLDHIPDWIVKCGFVDNTGLSKINEKNSVSRKTSHELDLGAKLPIQSSIPHRFFEIPPPIGNNPHIEFKNASVAYRGNTILQNFNWKIERGSKWRILGQNGSGKTTLLSMITAEHPQSWKFVLSIDGNLRRPGNGVTYFDVNNKIGISSPELHSLVPPRMTIDDILMNGLITNIGNSNFRSHKKSVHLSPHAQLILSHFESELKGYDKLPFIESSVSLQKLALFLRAVLKNPEILILDEAFSGMDGEVITKCHSFIREYLGDSTLLVVGHVNSEVPPHDYVLELTADSDSPYRFFATNKP